MFPYSASSRTLLAALLLMLFSLVRAESPAPTSTREQVEAIADVVEQNYFDPALGARFAAVLRADALQGRYDALLDPRELATALDARLRPMDGHFSVRWSPDSRPSRRAPREASTPGDAALRTGLRRVELLPGNIGLLELGHFADFEFDDRRAAPRLAIDAALQTLAWSDAVVIDLRDNGGGSSAMVGYLASAFTPRDADIYIRFHAREGTSSEAPGDWHPAPRLEVPLYLLISGRTGSAAEAFAYTLKHAGRATLVGERSAGKANPGRPFDAENGFRVFVSTEQAISPLTDDNWEGRGVVPDLTVEAADALRVAQIDALQRRLATRAAGPATDLQWILEALQAQSQTTPPPPAGYSGNYGEIAVRVVDGGQRLRQGRRPERGLLPLPSGDYSIEGAPHQRVHFEPAPQGPARALELRWPNGDASRFVRSG